MLVERYVSTLINEDYYYYYIWLFSVGRAESEYTKSIYTLFFGYYPGFVIRVRVSVTI